MGWDRRAASPLKCTLPTAEESVDRSLDVKRSLPAFLENSFPLGQCTRPHSPKASGECLGLEGLTSIIVKIVRRLMGSRDRMGLRTDVRLDLNYILLDTAALRDVTALQFVSTLWAAAVCSVSIVESCPKRSGLPASAVFEAWRLPQP